MSIQIEHMEARLGQQHAKIKMAEAQLDHEKYTLKAMQIELKAAKDAERAKAAQGPVTGVIA